MHIDWSAIGSVAGTALAAIMVVAVLFGLGTLSMSRYTRARAQGDAGTLNAVGAGLAFAGCVAIGLFGLFLTVVR
jgi:hypothetical protein